MISKFITNQFRSVAVLGAILLSGSAFSQLNLNWAEMGPNDIAGRCRSIMISKTDASNKTLYAGGVSGGVFKSTNGGSTWSPVNDLASSLIVSSLAQSNDGNTIYFGTGEAFGRGGNGAGASGFIGTGLFKFTSSSSAVVLVKDSSVFGNINEVKVDNLNNIYVAGQKGFFISTDGGANFLKEAISGTLSAMDVKIASNGDVYYSAGSKDISTSKVYRRDFGSSTFTDITPTSISDRGRIEIAVANTNSNYVYLSIAKLKNTTATSGGLSAILVSDDRGTTWKVITLGTVQFDPLSVGTTGYGDYANTITVDLSSHKTIYVGGDVFYSWTQINSNPLGQGNWTQIGTNFYSNNYPLPQLYIHSKIHDVAFDGVNNTFYIATDGGITKYVGGGFVPYNTGLNIAQFNSVCFPNFPRVNQGTPTNVAIPYAGVGGGAVGSSLTYLPGYYFNGIQTSTNFGSTDAYQSDFSKIIPKAVFYAGAFGSIFRSSDIDVAPPGTFYDQSFKGAIASAASSGPGTSAFANENTPMRLWENTGTLDSAIFYNEIVKTQFLNNNKTQAAFMTSNIRPQYFGKYDSIFIVATSAKLPPLTTQSITLVPVYTGTTISSVTVIGSANISAASNNTVYFNPTLKDSIKYTFLTAPNDSSTIKITIKMRYDAGDPITITNTDISGSNFVSSHTLTSTLYATASATSMPTVKIPLRESGRLAVGVNARAGDFPSVYVVKRPLNFAINPDWVKVCGKNSRIDDVGGIPSSTISPVLGTTVTRLEWAPDGQSIYFSTRQNDSTFYLYRISHLNFIGDSADADYGGIFTSDVDSFNLNTVRKKPSQRTTALGKFKYPITSISVLGDNSGVMITCGSYKNKTATVYTSNGDVRLLGMNNTDDTNFSPKNGTGLPLTPAYSSLFEMNDNKRALIGTESGIYSTTDITVASPVWVQENGGNFPNVPVFQIRQQTYPSYKCYNSGIIYAATHGRGIWSTDKYLTHYAIGVEENASNLSSSSQLSLYPNPASDIVSVVLNSASDASYKVSIYDVSGRLMSEKTTAKLAQGQNIVELNTTNLVGGVYFVSVSGTNNFTGTSKLVISK